jgi:Holliday junction resolvase-like predicted endonuclease
LETAYAPAVAELRVWSVNSTGDNVLRAPRSHIDLEAQLEDWIYANPSVLSEELTLVGRQVRVDGGPIDLLCTDIQGRWVIVELKRGKLYREAVAQAIDYARSIQTMSAAQLREIVSKHSDGPKFEELIAGSEDGANREVAIILAGVGSNNGLERVAGFLSDFGVPIRVVTFNVFEMDDLRKVLVREVFEEGPAVPRHSRTVEDISLMGEDEAIQTEFLRLVEIAQTHGLFARAYSRAVMITPATHRNRYLLYVRPVPGRGLEISHSAEAFEEFFGIAAGEVQERLGPSGKRLFDFGSMSERVRTLGEFLDQIAPT